MKKVFSTACSVAAVSKEDHNWPLVLIIPTSDGIYGSHAITMWKGIIYDSTYPIALRWSQRSLDWCSGLGSTCIGFSKVYKLCPADLDHRALHSPLAIGTQVQMKRDTGNSFGWVKRLPKLMVTGEQRRGYFIKYVDGGCSELDYLDFFKNIINT